MERIERLYAAEVPAAEALEIRFRHGGWMPDRQRVWAALQRCGMPAKRLERFNACGGGCVCEVQRGTGRGRLRAFYCGDRFCAPCAAARGRRVADNLRTLCEGKDVRFITLTLRGTDDALSAVFDRLIRSFVRLRDQKFWKRAVTAGAYCVEIKRGKFKKMWHVHLHALVVGSYIPHHELRDGWAKATDGSTVVDIRPVGKDSKRIGYVAKYATKGFDRSVLGVPDDLDECLCALRGRRVLGTFGQWRSVELEREPQEPGVWRAVGRFSHVWNRAVAGERWAVDFFRGMNIFPGGDGPQHEVISDFEEGEPFDTGGDGPLKGS